MSADTGQPGLRDAALVEARTTPERLGVLRLTWAHASEWVERCGREGRAAIVAVALRVEIDRARKAHVTARDAGETYRADLTAKTGKRAVDAIDGLDRALADLWRAMDEVERRVAQVGELVRDADRISDPGTWAAGQPGAARGRGIPGYDTAENVASVSREIQAGVARAQLRAAETTKRGKGRRAGDSQASARQTAPTIGLFDNDEEDP